MLKHLLPAGLCCLLLGWSLPAPAQVENSELGELTLEVLVGGLEHPWGLAFLPDGQGSLISERPGRLRWLDGQGRLSAPLRGVPAVFAQGQGGLLDVALSPDFTRDRLVYLSYAEADAGGERAGTAVGRGRLSDDQLALEGFAVIFRQQPKLSTGIHFGSRLVFDRRGELFITLGENGQRATAQQLDKLQGKLVRLHADGRIPADNPFVARAGARGEIWSYGHRNAQGAALNPWTGQLWLHEHGPRGGDEINIPQAGRNYGWPLATHGVNYSFLPIPEAKGERVAGTEPPHHVWEKSPALSGMAFYSAERFPAWRHSLFIGALAGQALIRLQLDGDRVVHEERLLAGRGWRIRDVRQGPDGYLYLLTDEADGQLLRLGLRQP
ncbi:PQQ-dependent aldose sugar dehydrogenase precursor (asd) [Pseudomonas sp. 8AS]|uniref:PQQ-dependent sugar dehydrogenase n=1 Tax=Pseudomonas sp. 8AS TaxID=2653163 RepID=UPI0012F0F654|nr:PQQ-dependent sugar dehydrogenase [Pseudomonas sp. 8AS]VXB67485.1 PQQ-dependent aldose sugar dehydrogenase precursor (asd) [Pseudomonas sp. 8AS]